ncbi:MAG: NAD-dependent epimerase/dehydratase family protein [Sporolactobacillus sp.]
MRILVTGAAGFIGSHLCERLLESPANQVVGLDAFLGNRELKEANLTGLRNHPRFQLVEANLLDADLGPLLEGIDAIFHLAGMPGVRSSWGPDFDSYVFNNILATQKLLEACRKQPIKKFIYVSTSSVYGEKKGPVSEDAAPFPLSPYGVSKLACEFLCHVYQENENLPLVIVRYFTVYGPRQRPDMAFHRFIKCALLDREIPIFGDGRQSRDFTYIDDCTAATASVLYAEQVIGETINIGGKERASVLDIIGLIEKLLNKKLRLNFSDKPKGEPRKTSAKLDKAKKLLSYQPKVSLEMGLAKEIDYFKKLYRK